VAPGSGTVLVSSAFSAATSRTASGAASVLRRMCTVPTLEIVAPVAASLAQTLLPFGPREAAKDRAMRPTLDQPAIGKI